MHGIEVINHFAHCSSEDVNDEQPLIAGHNGWKEWGCLQSSGVTQSVLSEQPKRVVKVFIIATFIDVFLSSKPERERE